MHSDDSGPAGFGGAGFDIGQLMASAQQMQAQVEQAQASLAEARVTGSAGGGLVRADVNGNGELVGIVIDPSVVDPADTETLADLVVAAVRDGMRAANELTHRQMSSVAGGLMGGLSLPGLDIPGLDAPGGAPYEGDLEGEHDDDFGIFDDGDEDDDGDDDGDDDPEAEGDEDDGDDDPDVDAAEGDEDDELDDSGGPGVPPAGR